MENKTAEFDEFVDDYNEAIVKDLGKFGKYRDTAFVYKANNLKYILKNEPKNILDFGCGIGSFIPYLHDTFKNAKLFGCDVSSESINIAKKNNPYCSFQCIKNTDDLKNYENIDCIIINTVLHHIPQNEHEYWINGLYNILSKKESAKDGGGGGYIVVFEHNMKNPITKLSVKRAKIDENAVMLNSHYCKKLLSNKFYNVEITDKEIFLKKDSVKMNYTYFFPWRNKLFTNIEKLLFWLPFGAQYCVFAKNGN